MIYNNLRNAAGGLFIAVSSYLCGGCNNAPIATLTESNGTVIKTVTNTPYRFEISLDREDINEGLEDFVFIGRDNDGPNPLRASSVYTVGNNPMIAVTNQGGSGNRNKIEIPFKITHVGNKPISRGTYDLLKISLDDGWFFNRPLTYTIAVDISRDIPNNDPNGDNGDSGVNGQTPIEDLLSITRAEFVDDDGMPLLELTSKDFRIELSMPEELANRVGVPTFTTHEYGNNPCIKVNKFNEPREIDEGVWEVNGTLTVGNCTSPYELLEGSFGLDIGNGRVFVNDSLEVILGN